MYMQCNDNLCKFEQSEYVFPGFACREGLSYELSSKTDEQKARGIRPLHLLSHNEVGMHSKKKKSHQIFENERGCFLVEIWKEFALMGKCGRVSRP